MKVLVANKDERIGHKCIAERQCIEQGLEAYNNPVWFMAQ